VGEVPEVTGAVVAALTEAGHRVRQVVPGGAARPLRADRYEADLSSPGALKELHRLVAGPDGAPVGALINFLGLAPPGGVETEAPVTIAATTFQLVKEFADDLRASAGAGGGWFLNVTALDGQFGLKGGEVSGVAAAGTLGVSKTLRREHPGLRVKAVDVEPGLPPDLLAARLLDEWSAEDDLLEVGLTRQGRWRLLLKQEPVPRHLPPPALDARSVVLVTGGASGITAAVARALAASARPRLVLVGRSALPGPEGLATRGLDRAALRRVLLDEARRARQTVVPAEVERRVNRVLKDREIRANLDACTAAGATVEYHSLDVRDPRQLGSLVEDLYERFGRIDGVVHGAGVIEDRRIADKSPESFANVFRTKVDGAWTLARTLRPDGLKFLAFFGSVSGRFGNAGQVDYSAANEAINKLADHLAARWPARVVCINWGPWDAGMVGDELRRLYATRGIELIPVEAGTRAFLDEVRLPAGSAEVIIAASVEQMARAGR
jgi:NAD(P)-dependent dehydrogenase (short-subunit alcohol dehydrogenase family)